MNLNIQLVPEDYVQASYLNMRPRPTFKWAGYFILLLSVLVLGISGYQCLFHSEACDAGKSGILFGVLAGSLAYLAFVFGYSYPKRIRNLYAQQKTLQSPYRMEVTDEGMLTQSEIGNSKLTWDYFRKWKEGKNLFAVYQSDVLMHIFPKRCFASPEELTEFRELLRAKLGPACH